MLPPNCLERERARRTHYKNKTIKHFLGKLAITTKSFDHTHVANKKVFKKVTIKKIKLK
jgi:hypothetical protein